MRWLGFGRGFVYSEPEVTSSETNNTQEITLDISNSNLLCNEWPPAARAASIAARKASKAALGATPKGNLLTRLLLGERFTRTTPTHSLSRSAVDSATVATKGKTNYGVSPEGEHKGAAEMHEIAAKELRESGNIKGADLHDKASRLHHEASKMYSK